MLQQIQKKPSNGYVCKRYATFIIIIATIIIILIRPRNRWYYLSERMWIDIIVLKNYFVYRRSYRYSKFWRVWRRKYDGWIPKTSNGIDEIHLKYWKPVISQQILFIDSLGKCGCIVACVGGNIPWRRAKRKTKLQQGVLAFRKETEVSFLGSELIF